MDFFFVQVAPFADFEVSELDLAYCDASQLQNADVMCLAHASDLSVSALVELKASDRAVFGLTDFSYAYGECRLAVEIDRFTEDREVLADKFSFDRNVIYLRYRVARMGELIGKRAVVCEQNEPV